jgi:hypothetical protein
VKAQHFHVFLLAGALALVGAVLAMRRPSGPAPAPRLAPLAIVPAGAAFVLDIDLARLRKSKTGKELTKLGWARLAATGSSAAFQPLRDVDEVVVAVPGTARRANERTTVFEPDSLAVVAVGRFTSKAAADAAVDRIRERGGDPVRTPLGSFESVRDLRATGEVATRDGLFVLSDGAYLRAVLAAAEGHRSDGNPSEKIRDRVHAELRRSFGRGAPITATLTLPEGSLEAALGDPEVRLSPLSLVRSAAVRINVGERIDLDALLVCATADDCTSVAKFLVEVQGDIEHALGSNAAPRRLGEIRENKERIEFSLPLTIDDIAGYLAPPEPSAPPVASTSAPAASASLKASLPAPPSQ